MSTPRSAQVNLGAQLIALVIFVLQQYAQYTWYPTTGYRVIRTARTDIKVTPQCGALILEWTPPGCTLPTTLVIEARLITMQAVTPTNKRYDVVVNSFSEAAVVFFGNQYARRLGSVPEESPSLEELFELVPVLVA